MTASSGNSAELPPDFRHRVRALVLSRGALTAAAAGTFALCWLNIVWLPAVPVTPALDSSWSGALIYFAARGLQYGRDVIFTFGPLGHLTSVAYTGELFAVRVVWTLLSGTVFAAILTLSVFRLPLFWRAPFLLFLLLFAWRPDSVHMVVFVALAAELFRRGDQRLAPNVFAGAVLGVCSLIKFSYLLLAFLLVALVIASYLLRKRASSALALALSFTAALLLAWKIAGQDFASLWPYLRYSKEVALGYKEAMALSAASDAVITLGVAAALLALGLCALLFFSSPTRHQLWPPLAFSGVTFLAWNQGFVRADDHVLEFFAVCPVALTLIWNAMDARPVVRRRGYGMTAAVFLACLAGTWVQKPEIVGGSVMSAHARMKNGWAALTSSGKIRRNLDKKLARGKAREALPRVRAEIAGASVDVFGYEQGIALLNELNYTPRPVFQSYCAYTPALIDANSAFYRSAKAPAYVLVKLAAIDGRMPSLEDAEVLREILDRYEFLFEERGYFLWKRRTDAPAAAQLDPLPTRKIRFDRKVRLPEAGLAWMQLDFRRSLAGTVRAALYKPPDVYIRATDSTGVQTRHRIVPAMTARGFFIQPRLAVASDLVKAAAGENLPRIVSFTIETAEQDRRYFRDRVGLRLSVQNAAGRPESGLAKVK